MNIASCTDDVSDARFRQPLSWPCAHEMEHAGRMKQTIAKLPETSSISFARISGFSDKLQSIAARIAHDDAVRNA